MTKLAYENLERALEKFLNLSNEEALALRMCIQDVADRASDDNVNVMRMAELLSQGVATSGNQFTKVADLVESFRVHTSDVGIYFDGNQKMKPTVSSIDFTSDTITLTFEDESDLDVVTSSTDDILDTIGEDLFYAIDYIDDAWHILDINDMQDPYVFNLDDEFKMYVWITSLGTVSNHTLPKIQEHFDELLSSINAGICHGFTSKVYIEGCDVEVTVSND